MFKAFAILTLPAVLLATESASKEITLTTQDGFILHGTFTLPAAPIAHPGKKARRAKKTPVVLLAHEFQSDRKGWGVLPEKLHARGLATLALDLRGHGQSTQRGTETLKVTGDFKASAQAVGFDKIPQDLVQAVTWLRKQPGIDAKKIGLIGASVGGFSVITAAGKVKPCAVMSLSPAGNMAFGSKAEDMLLDGVRASKAHVAVFASKADKQAAANATRLKEIDTVFVSLVEGEEHGMDYLKNRVDTMAVWFGEYLNYSYSGYSSSAPRTETGAIVNTGADQPTKATGLDGRPLPSPEKVDPPTSDPKS